MIITVTLNAAIDKTLAVPNFRLGRRHRAVEQTVDGGRQGRERGPGAQVAGPAGDRHRRGRRPHRHPHHRAAHATRASSTTSCASATSRARPPPWSTPPPASRRRSTSTGPTVTRGRARPVRGQAPLPGPGRRGLRLRRQPPARASNADLYGRLIDELKRLGVTTVLDSEGEPLLLGHAPRPDLVSPNELEAEGLVGREFADDEDRRTGIAEMVELGARESIMTRPAGASRLLGDGPEPQLYRVTLEPLEPVSAVGSGDAFLAGFVAARYCGPPERGLPALRGGLRRRVDPALRRRGARPARGRAPRCRRSGWRRWSPPRTVPEAVWEAVRPASGDVRAPVLSSRSSVVEPRMPHGSRDRSRQEGPSRVRLR